MQITFSAPFLLYERSEQATGFIAVSSFSIEILIKNMISVLLADDHTIIRDLFRRLLEAAGDIQIVAVASNGQEAVEQAVLYKPNVAVLDISMPSMNGIEATRQIIVHCPQTHILMATMHNTSLYIEHSIIAGVLGYVLKEQASYDLVIAIRAVNEGNRYFSKQIEEIAKRFI